MTSKGISTTESEKNFGETSNEEQSDSIYDATNIPQILLEMDEKPELTIEKILINIFNKFITPGNVEFDNSDLQPHLKKVKILCLKNDKSKIIYILLTKIRSLIKKYREKLFELPNIIELREKIFRKYYKRSHSFSKLISKHYINFALDRPSINHSFSKTKNIIFNYYLTVKNLFFELKNIKNCLRRTAPIIEEIFEVPLSKFPKFSIWECEKEDYLKILIHDNFIWDQIVKSKNSYLKDIISEITQDDNTNLTEMSDRIDYFKLMEEYKKLNIDDMLKLSEVGSSLDTRFPEDAKPFHLSKEEIYQNKIDKDIHCSFEEEDIDDYPNSEDQNAEGINSINEYTLIKTLRKKITIQTKSREITKSILARKSINKINIREDNKYIDFPISNLLKSNDLSDLSNKDNLEKMIALNKNTEIKKIYENNFNINNINNNSKQRKKQQKNKNKNKKESKERKKSNKKIDIPNDIDDLVKYIVNDDKNENTGKKKKKNKKKKKKNKNEIKEDKKEEIEDNKEKEKNDEIEEIKENLTKNSINRYKIHKIKFKYKPKWINKISKIKNS